MAPSLQLALVALVAGLASVSANPLPTGEHVAAADQGSRQCTVTMPVFPRFTSGPVKTVYTSTVTATRGVDCGTCDHVAVSTMRLGPGPVVFFTTTTTAATPSTTTVLKCARTAEPAQAAAQ